MSPAHLLMGRRLRTTLPMLPSYLEPDVVSRNIVHWKDRQKNRSIISAMGNSTSSIAGGRSSTDLRHLPYRLESSNDFDEGGLLAFLPGSIRQTSSRKKEQTPTETSRPQERGNNWDHGREIEQDEDVQEQVEQAEEV